MPDPDPVQLFRIRIWPKKVRVLQQSHYVHFNFANYLVSTWFKGYKNLDPERLDPRYGLNHSGSTTIREHVISKSKIWLQPQ
jgi:hypothetical protein